jgi:dihydrofolate reductase
LCSYGTASKLIFLQAKEDHARDKEALLAKVIFDISMSLDGFMTATNVRPEEPLGDGGQRLHEWAFDEDERNRQLLAEAANFEGAVIAGRRTYDLSVAWWGADGPTGPARVPVFVLTHAEPEEVPEGGVYTFVTDGIQSALERAKAAAGEEDVSVMGGAEIGQQYIRAGLIEEIAIHLVPVLFGSGTRMFEHLGSEHIRLEPMEVIEATAATHLRFRVLK